MTNSKIWLVVKPTVGLPLFLGGVATISLCIHAAVLTSTDWYPAYLQGNQKAKVAAAAASAAVHAEEAAAPAAKPATKAK